MQIILSRHGNTFSPDDSVVWVGAKQDLPLVASGVQQAKELARVIQQAGLTLKAVYCGPLQRTHDYAHIVLKKLHASLKPIVDFRLNEIDYGNWSGLSNVHIQEKGGSAELSAWEDRGQWPKEAGWLGSSAFIFSEVKAFAEDLLKQYDPDDTILIITSNGRLRYFLQLIPGLFEQYIQNKQVKVATGHLCLLIYTHSGWEVKCWNKNPSWFLENKL